MFPDRYKGITFTSFLRDPMGNIKEAKRIKKKLQVDNRIVFVFGLPGSGKSTITAFGAQALRERYGYTQIVLTGKRGKPFDYGMSIFPADQPYHLERLKEQKDEPSGYSTKFYNPITLNLPKIKLPPINFYTYSLKDISSDAFRSLFHNVKDGTILSVFKFIKNQMKDGHDIIDFNWLLYNALQDTETDIYADTHTNWIPMETEGTKATRDSILNALNAFTQIPILKPHRTPTNLDMETIIKDKEHIHIFLSNWITDLYYFDKISLIDEIEKVLDKPGNQHLKVLIVLEELESNIPMSGKTKAQEILSSRLWTLLNQSRSKDVFFIGNSQNYHNTDSSFRRTANEKFILQCSDEDRARLLKDHPEFSSANIRRIKNLKRGEYYWWYGSGGIVQKSYMPTHRILEEGEDFITYFVKHRPEATIDYKPLLKQWQDEARELDNKSKQYYLEYKQKHKEMTKSKRDEQKEQKLEKTQQELEYVKERMKETQKIAKKEQMKQCYELKKNDPTLSWRKIGEKVGISHNIVKGYALTYAKEVQDINFGMQFHGA